ncbi:Hydroxymethylglutaryl-CoA synthase protein [Spatholobus suberectus]|nr:Hydroxymethylglutaryl-CoA synthase protein [Spatholobus suberectus]
MMKSIADYVQCQTIFSAMTFLFQVYAEGPTCPTGVAAAIAMLVGPGAHIALESEYPQCPYQQVCFHYSRIMKNEMNFEI